jgi:hypothetical protein
MNFFYLMMPNFSVKNVGFINISTLMISVIEGIRNQITPKFVAEIKSPNHIQIMKTMKKGLFIVACLFGLAPVANAQMGPVSLGLEIALPMGDFGDAYGLGYGLSVGYEHPLGDNLALGAQIGYIMLSPKEEIKDFIKSSSMMPLQVAAKYYFSEQQNGAYAMALIGVHNSSVTTEDIDLGPFGTIEGETVSNTNLSFGLGAGFVVNNKIDIALRYNIITPDSDIEDAESSNYVGIRAAYNLFGGE